MNLSKIKCYKSDKKKGKLKKYALQSIIPQQNIAPSELPISL